MLQGLFVSPMYIYPVKQPTGEYNVYVLYSYFFAEEAEVFFEGTFAPFSLASERPIAMACFGLVTFLADLPLFNVPFSIFFMDDSTLFWAASAYFAMD